MFTGIVERSVHVVSITQGAGFCRMSMASAWDDVQRGESIAINGVCLTVAEISALPASAGRAGLRPAPTLGFDVIPETLARTNLGLLQEGEAVHIERAMRASDRISGHFVQGHVDGPARLVSNRNENGEVRLVVSPPMELMKYIVPKGSVALDGVSLTVAAVSRESFEVALIPTTVQMTHLGTAPTGWPFNLETDVLARTVVSWLEAMELG